MSRRGFFYAPKHRYIPILGAHGGPNHGEETRQASRRLANGIRVTGVVSPATAQWLRGYVGHSGIDQGVVLDAAIQLLKRSKRDEYDVVTHRSAPLPRDAIANIAAGIEADAAAEAVRSS